MANSSVKHAEVIRGVLDGGQLQFHSGSGWIDAGGEPQAWLTLLTIHDTRESMRFRIKPTNGVPVHAGNTTSGETPITNVSAGTSVLIERGEI